MTKKKKIIIGLSITLVILLAFIGGNVLAKYQTQLRGRGIANIAHWSFNVNGYGSTIQTIAINENYNEDTLINGRIAPGTEGSFDIVLDADGTQVGVDYAVEFMNEQNKPANLKFRYNNQEYGTLQELESVLTGRINADDSDKLKLFTITWFWAYETGPEAQKDANNLADTNDGINALDYTFDVVVTGTQAQPQA